MHWFKVKHTGILEKRRLRGRSYFVAWIILPSNKIRNFEVLRKQDSKYKYQTEKEQRSQVVKGKYKKKSSTVHIHTIRSILRVPIHSHVNEIHATFIPYTVYILKRSSTPVFCWCIVEQNKKKH